MRALFVFLFFITLSFAKLNVVVTYPWIGDLVDKIGKEKVKVYIIAKGTEDPHFVVPKPSHIAKLRRADLLIIQGASLEIGFLPPLLSQSNNPKIQPGTKGFLDLSTFIELIEKPKEVSRAMGDVHPEGNPHYNLDPHNIPVLAQAIKDRLCLIDPGNCEFYGKNLNEFLAKWNEKLEVWDREFSTFRGTRVISYHSVFNYLLRRYGVVLVATLEPLPGIPPTKSHIQKLLSLKDIKYVLLAVYNERRTAQFVAKELGAKVLVLPHDVNSLPEVKDNFSLFDEILRRLKGG
ncbi:metal ABC transporter solute-binding protein, Zn/Mn family [Aquifex aeolicus]|uniref:Adhesion protein n=1 Tax=Aquifex aeolicus (strain VF5) TaxID=224324 RepID=O67917_AQUAE|nr:zinc ABC transporter substrate-binding protein [Aquifex aeolicus]AAC07876.1 adhesion protein [Aquifex aeolicus VF5]